MNTGGIQHIGCGGDCRGAGSGEETRHVTILLLREKLLYDIENNAWIEAHVMPEEAEHSRHMTADIGQEGNADRIDRILALAWGAAVEMLYPYTKRPIDEEVEELDDAEWAPEEYLIEMDVPATMSATTTGQLTRLVHEYMTYRALQDWLGTTHPEAAARWAEKAYDIEVRINTIKNYRRGGGLRRKSYPF